LSFSTPQGSHIPTSIAEARWPALAEAFLLVPPSQPSETQGPHGLKHLIH
jgi:hypothetical protein